MGITVGEWSFTQLHALTIETIAKSLSSQMQLEVLIPDDGHDPSIDIPLLKERFVDVKIEPYRISVDSIFPENQYVWSHLNFCMAQNGGALPDPTLPDSISWRPHPHVKELLRPWTQLSWKQQLVLKHPFVYRNASATCDRWLYPDAHRHR